MKRSRRVRALWSWLPAFRAAAETEHLPTASAALFVGRSSLSRTIRMLEEELGAPLFDRVGRGIRLNAAGRAMLAVVRDAMRLVDEGIAAVIGEELAGPVRLSADPEIAGLILLPALGELTERHPELVPEVDEHDPREVVSRLLAGVLDVALLSGEPPSSDRLRASRLGALEHGVYAGPTHPLFSREAPFDLDTLGAYPFVAPTTRAARSAPDHWPAEHPRRIGLGVANVELALQACRDQPWLAALPELLVRHHPLGGSLRRLDGGGVSAPALYALCRAPVGEHPRTEALLDAVRARAAHLELG